ncbi:formylglycine-generating enzyme family protein [Chitinivibrio alkaliphilus]|uniref:Sulfatase-modifying factor enzyme-like domain-containing protein n=1 Tax=Chitinivibrio alkaliphilus ACht1 TaxID=1313304 RepID=U7D8J3_9BACT|nr:formylglycine-generating enzyme family protein [Chitinivibrio alkaliphilus]ERP30750.1 hypothetical protein CALK_2415 [Chitinivibrio alkaliphilus ACht1]
MSFTKTAGVVLSIVLFVLIAGCNDVTGSGDNGNDNEDTSLDMITIPAGTFLYRRGESDQEEKAVAEFQISKYTITQGEYLAVMGVNPSRFTGNENRPVETVTWFDAVLYCNALSKAEGRDTVYSYSSISGTPGDGVEDLADLAIDSSANGYYLPTSVQWEYAVRGGTTTTYFWGRSFTDADDYAWHDGNSGSTTHPVGQKLPNDFGLYDMVGNVSEWCETRVWQGGVLTRVVRGGG